MRLSLLVAFLATTPTQPIPPPTPDASPTLRGLVNIGQQSFGGFKIFDAGISAPNVVQTTSGALTFYVDAASGNDSNACTSSGAGACLTIQKALNKIPKMLRDQVTVSIAAGTYAGFIVSGFMADEGFQQTTGGLLINGALTNSTLASGSATGTATGGSAGSNQTFATLIDPGGAWTTNDLTGRFLCTSNNTICPVIESNSSTTITIVGTTALGWAAPVGGVTTYQIRDPSVIVNTSATLPPSPFIAAIASRAGVIALDNSPSARDGMITFQNMRISPSTGGGFELGGTAAYLLNQVQVRPTASNARGIRTVATGLASGTFTTPQLELQFTDIFMSTSSNEGILWDSNASFLSFGGTFVRGIATGGKSQFGISTASGINFQFSEVSGFANAIRLRGPTTSNTQIGSSRLYCGSYTSTVAMAVGNTTTGGGNNTNGISAHVGANFIDHVDLAVCDTGLLVVGASTAELHGFTGNVGRTLVQVLNGGYVGVNQVNLTPASVLIGDGGPGTGIFVNLDNVIYSDAGTDFGVLQNLGICLGYWPTGSRACGR
jgi:hypothetical protein